MLYCAHIRPHADLKDQLLGIYENPQEALAGAARIFHKWAKDMQAHIDREWAENEIRVDMSQRLRVVDAERVACESIAQQIERTGTWEELGNSMVQTLDTTMGHQVWLFELEKIEDFHEEIEEIREGKGTVVINVKEAANG